MLKPDIKTFVPQNHPLSSFALTTLKPGCTIAVIGAGAFGGWSALSLLRKHFKVILIDAFGPGNAQSSSGDETRVIRSTYGNNELYFDLNVRSLALWKTFEKDCSHKIFFNKGVIWLCHKESTPMVDDSVPFTRKHGMEYQYLSKTDLKKKYPSINSNDLHHAYFDPFGGYLHAREACNLVKEQFVKEGGKYISSSINPGVILDRKLQSVELSDGSSLKADAFLFACGSWLGKVFPEVLGDVITPTKQEVYYFSVPPKFIKYFEQLPVWVDVDGHDFYYGIPSSNGGSFKIGVDKRGELFDPDDERTLNTEVLAEATKFITHRFPDLKDAPLADNRICLYENSPDGNFIIDHHPEAENVIIVGGGSGHGFKHGPAVGELTAEALTGNKTVPGLFSLSRFNSNG